MNRFSLVCAILLLIGLCFCGCASDYDIVEIYLDIPEGWVEGDIAANSTNIYYVAAQERFMGNDMVQAQIISCSRNDNETKICKDYKDPNGFYINELEATEDYLFWVRSYRNNTVIECMDLISGEILVVEENKNYLQPVLLQSDGSYLTWYYVEDGQAYVKAYDIEQKETMIIAYNVELEFPYMRAEISDGIYSYASVENNKKYINIYDINDNSKIAKFEINSDAEIFRIEADAERCVYSLFLDGVVDNRIFIYDYSSNETYLGNDSEEAYVFSFHYMNGEIYINDHETNSIIIKDAEDMSNTIVLDEEEHLFILGNKTISGDYIALDALNPEEPYIIIISNK